MCIGGTDIGASVHRRQLEGGHQNEAPVLKDRTKRHRSSRGTIVAIETGNAHREGDAIRRPSLYTRVAVAVSFVVVDGVAHICFRTNICTSSYLFHVKSPYLHHVKYRA